MSDPQPKRQRLTGSFSPASPPYHLAKASDQTKPLLVHPSTPTSPPCMSTPSQPNAGFATTAAAPSSDMTPPSASIPSQQPSQTAPSATNLHPFPTPGSTTGVATSSHPDGDSDTVMVDDESNTQRSDHDRQGGASGSSLFKLCQSTYEISRPHGSQNLFELYSLDDLAKSVARVDPTTGEKINKLRKSYEGHIKALQIAGKVKATKLDGEFTNLLAVPEEDWHGSRVIGKEIERALEPDGSRLNSNWDSLLNSAFAGIAPGPLGNKDTNSYKQYLGLDEVLKVRGAPEGATPRSVPATAATPHSATPVHPARLGGRPERAGSKRSYNETSFSGYGEGFADDFTGNSTGGEDAEGGLSKKRRLGGFERGPHQVEVGGVRR